MICHSAGSASPRFQNFALATPVFSPGSTQSLTVYQTSGCQSNSTPLLTRGLASQLTRRACRLPAAESGYSGAFLEDIL